MLAILEPYLPMPQEADVVEDALRGVAFPDWVINWDYELASDEDGNPAVWVNLFVDETRAPRHEFGRVASRLTTSIQDALRQAGSTRWVYVRRANRG